MKVSRIERKADDTWGVELNFDANRDVAQLVDVTYTMDAADEHTLRLENEVVAQISGKREYVIQIYNILRQYYKTPSFVYWGDDEKLKAPGMSRESKAKMLYDLLVKSREELNDISNEEAATPEGKERVRKLLQEQYGLQRAIDRAKKSWG